MKFNDFHMEFDSEATANFQLLPLIELLHMQYTIKMYSFLIKWW